LFKGSIGGDNEMALSSIATEQAKPTQKTMATVKQLLDYCATQEEAIITYTASKMILCIHSDAGYANKKNSRSWAGGHFYLSNNDQHPPNNGAIMTNSTIIKVVMSSAAEAELGVLFLNAKEGVYLDKYLPKWAIRNHALQSRPTTRQRKASLIMKSSPSGQRQWTCDSIGYATARHRDNFEFIGAQGKWT
jgi:hypothetical protein